HHPLGIDGFVAARLELLAGQDVDRDFLERQALEPKRDPDPERGKRAPETINLYAHRPPLHPFDRGPGQDYPRRPPRSYHLLQPSWNQATIPCVAASFAGNRFRIGEID